MIQVEKVFDAEKAYDYLVGGLRDFFYNPGFKAHFIVGLSGGLDSALVTKIAVDAFGSNRVHGLILPSTTTSEESVNLALELAKGLKVDVKGLPIGKICDDFVENFNKNLECDIDITSKGNIVARMRMIALMAASNSYGWVLLNTSNRSEALLGYCTLYGDSAGAFSPIGDMFKTEVFEMAKLVNERAVANGEKPPIPQGIIDRPPSAELFEGQTDEAYFGASYDVVDDLLWKLTTEQMTPEDAAALGYDQNLCQRLMQMHMANKFKMNYYPPHTVYHSEEIPNAPQGDTFSI